MVFLTPDVFTLSPSWLCRRSAERPTKKAQVKGPSPRAPGASEVLALAPQKGAGSASSASDPSSTASALQAPTNQGPSFVEADALGYAGVDVGDVLDAGADQEALTGNGSPRSSPSSGVSPLEAASTPDMPAAPRSEEHTSELQSLRRISYAVFCLKK